MGEKHRYNSKIKVKDIILNKIRINVLENCSKF